MRKSSISHLTNVELKELTTTGLSGMDAVKRQIADLQGKDNFDENYVLPDDRGVDQLRSQTTWLDAVDANHYMHFNKLDVVLNNFFNEPAGHDAFNNAIIDYNNSTGASYTIPTSTYQTIPELNQKLTDLTALVSNGGSVLDPGVQMLNSSEVHASITAAIAANSSLATDIASDNTDPNFLSVTFLTANGYIHFANLFGYTGATGTHVRTRYIVDPNSAKYIVVTLPGPVIINAYKGWILELTHFHAAGTGPSNYVISPVTNNLIALLDTDYDGNPGTPPIQTVWLCVKGGGVSESAAWVRVSGASAGGSGLANLYDLPSSQGAGTLVGSGTGLYPSNSNIQGASVRSFLFNADKASDVVTKDIDNAFAFSSKYAIINNSYDSKLDGVGNFIFGQMNEVVSSPMAVQFGWDIKTYYSRNTAIVGSKVAAIGGTADIIPFNNLAADYTQTRSLIQFDSYAGQNMYKSPMSGVYGSYNSVVLTPSSNIIGGAYSRISSIRNTSGVISLTDELSHHATIVGSSRSFIVGGTFDPCFQTAMLSTVAGSNTANRKAWYDRMFDSNVNGPLWESRCDFYDTTTYGAITTLRELLGPRFGKYGLTRAIVQSGMDVSKKYFPSPGAANNIYLWRDYYNANELYSLAINPWYNHMFQTFYTQVSGQTGSFINSTNTLHMVKAAVKMLGLYDHDPSTGFRGFNSPRYRGGQSHGTHSFTNNSGSHILGGADNVIMGGSVGASISGGEFNLINNSSFADISGAIRSVIVCSPYSSVNGMYNIISDNIHNLDAHTDNIYMENSHNHVTGLNNTVVGDASYNNVSGRHNAIYNLSTYIEPNSASRNDYNFVHGYANDICMASGSFVFGDYNHIFGNHGSHYAVVGHTPPIGRSDMLNNTINGMSICSGYSNSSLVGAFTAFMFASHSVVIEDSQQNTYVLLGVNNVTKNTSFTSKLSSAATVVSSNNIDVRNNGGFISTSDTIGLGSGYNIGANQGRGYSTVLHSSKVTVYNSALFGVIGNNGADLVNGTYIASTGIQRLRDGDNYGRMASFGSHDMVLSNELKQLPPTIEYNTYEFNLSWYGSKVYTSADSTPYDRVSFIGSSGFTILGGTAQNIQINMDKIAQQIAWRTRTSLICGTSSGYQGRVKNTTLRGKVVIAMEDLVLYDAYNDRYLTLDYMNLGGDGRIIAVCDSTAAHIQ